MLKNILLAKEKASVFTDALIFKMEKQINWWAVLTIIFAIALVLAVFAPKEVEYNFGDFSIPQRQLMDLISAVKEAYPGQEIFTLCSLDVNKCINIKISK